MPSTSPYDASNPLYRNPNGSENAQGTIARQAAERAAAQAEREAYLQRSADQAAKTQAEKTRIAEAQAKVDSQNRQTAADTQSQNAALAGQQSLAKMQAEAAAAAAQARAGTDAQAAEAARAGTRAESAASLAEREAANQRASAAALTTYNSITGGGGGTPIGGGGGGGLPAGGGGGRSPSPTMSSNPGITPTPGDPSLPSDSTPGGSIQGNEAAARSAAFARAKEQAGQSAQASLSGLRNALSRRGISGGGYANMRAAESLAPAADQLQDFSREQMISDFNRASDISDRDAAGNLTRRGQDITLEGHRTSSQLAQQQSLLGLLNGSRLY